MRLSLASRSLTPSSTRDQVYALLREAIVAAEFEPGRRLSENELAARIGVSRTPVREALIRLEDERLVAIVPQLGTFVTLISPGAVADAAFVREALECGAIGRVRAPVDAGELDSLQANLAAQERAAEAHDATAFDRLDEDLHRQLCALGGHEIAWELSRRANGHLDRVRRLSLPAPGYLEEMLSEHQAVVVALARGDVPGAETALRHHLRMVRSYEHAIRDERPEFFGDD